MKNPQLIDKIKQLEKEFQAEPNCLKKMIIIHKYMDFLKTEKTLKAMFEEENSKTAKTLNSLMTGSTSLADFDIQTGKTNFDNNSIFFYTFLDAMYKTMEEYKVLTDKNKIAEFKNNVELAFKDPNQIMVYNMSFTVLNKKIIDELSTEDFIKGHKDNIFFNNQKSILHIKGKKVKIKRKADLPIEHYILEYLFEQEDKTEEAYYQDIATEKLKELEYDNAKDWKKYYNACERLQEKIRIATNINDFLIFTTNKTGNVKINKKYLEKLD
ncbi:hypothetical protein A2331_02550 [Candidatus Falkowbacteria bacterium RIFOXYB2_FULL_34_18]|uniref:Uncharacterized protein n=1 Tax=Candidatus Falkowbacteria bacterium RIFOXYD2_FULL_34_120 TaxID=1798007 RepID=A0A1F5TQP8_9BACT|nr:MAG: hypothetical protein A2331_02550 [Candidatus Falkowbacteria bacterium RIFOXYB2_FULL_34_18]OGF29500.1 MAG: hypothetical protein A2500_04400 [Candidatus Falkowbacteria bacterium RIFOXYC12_FULL_34_55]OGF36317.1 MAG: hypothetical protein A2466_05410 [Candidatus Falkowbacteria bacterium RIFOXYC2_FULL_34_220]OGF39026.1 MAG: hypothetical protein A2515_06865 [Candidatus Falkowbacteria bacterium RIFOXYD12_FULL_34_57]OGF41245.1 MAG: hypothetical protein A2531_01105 [Candidatus Falkowbacteria bact